MVESQAPVDRIPLSDIEEYFEKHKDLTINLYKLFKDEVLSKEDLEKKFPTALKKIKNVLISEILKKNKIAEEQDL